MRRRIAAAGILAVALVALAAVSPLALSATSPPALTATSPPAAMAILDSYRSALATRKIPNYMLFEYTVTKSGPNRIVTQQHRVYWTASGLERNDTIAVNGTPLVPARSMLLHRALWPYDVGQFAVSPDEYDAVPAGIALVSGRKAYPFTVTRARQADFMLTSLYVDASSRMPLRETFVVNGSECQGSGSIDFLPVGAYWLPTFISVVCTGSAQGASPAPVFKEAIRFGAYRFPASIPPDVFGQPPSAAASGAPSSDSGATLPPSP